MKLAIPDMISNSYFPAIRGDRAWLVQAGKASTSRWKIDLSGRTSATRRLRDGRRVEFRRRLGAIRRSRRFRKWQGVKAPRRRQAQGMVLVS